MHKPLAALAIAALLLVACSRNPGPSSVPSIPYSSVTPTPSQQVIPEPVGSVGVMTCRDSFTSLSPLTLEEITSLANAGRDLDATIQRCDTLQAWKDGAQAVLPTIDLSNARDFVVGRCQANQQLAGTRLCASVGS